MKIKIFTNLMFAFILATGTLLFSACGKDEEETSPATASTNSASATIGSSNFTSTKMTAETEDIFGENMINIDYVNQAGDTLRLAIFESSTTGQQLDYQLNDPNTIDADFLINYIKADGSAYIPSTGNNGQMTISLHDKTAKILKGTFSGTLTSDDGNNTSITVSNGKFEAKY